MQVRAVAPEVDADALLPGAQFVDAYRIAVGGAALNARQAATKMLEQGPRWIDALMALRDALVTPFGLKTPDPGRLATGNAIGIFPVVSETPERIVAGFDDSHLDFRVVIDIGGIDAARTVTATTLVQTHNWLGRSYLATIMPFHRLVVRAMLRQIVA